MVISFKVTDGGDLKIAGALSGRFLSLKTLEFSGYLGSVSVFI